MPKAELHLHLDGSLRVETAIELARTRGVDAPRDRAGMAAALIAPMPCRDQAELLRAFDLPIALMQDAEALERITAELVEDQGGRRRPLRRDPLGTAPPRRPRAVARRTGSPPSARARARPARGPARSSG